MQPGKPSQALTRTEQKELATRFVLTKWIADHIVDSVEHGLFEKQACEFAGISFPVYRQWEKWAEGGLEPYVTLFRRVNAAKQRRLKFALQQIENESPGWKAHAWWVERMFPEWREDNKTDDPPPPDHTIDALAAAIKAKYLPEEIERLAKILVDPDPVITLLPQGGDSHDDDGEDSEPRSGEDSDSAA